MKLPESTMTTTTEQTTATMATYKTAAPTQSQSQRIASAMQQAFQQKKKPGLPGGGSGPPGRGGGSGPPGRGQPPATQQPIPPALDVKVMGSLPQIFYGDQSKANDFIEEVKGYFHLNAGVAGYNSPYKKVAFTLTLVKGEETAQWVRNMGNWLNMLDPIADNVEDLWQQFLKVYAYQFQDSQATQRA